MYSYHIIKYKDIMQEVPFRIVKGHLLHPYMPPFAMQKAVFLKNIISINIFIVCKNISLKNTICNINSVNSSYLLYYKPHMKSCVKI